MNNKLPNSTLPIVSSASHLDNRGFFFFTKENFPPPCTCRNLKAQFFLTGRQKPSPHWCQGLVYTDRLVYFQVHMSFGKSHLHLMLLQELLLVKLTYKFICIQVCDIYRQAWSLWCSCSCSYFHFMFFSTYFFTLRTSLLGFIGTS